MKGCILVSLEMEVVFQFACSELCEVQKRGSLLQHFSYSFVLGLKLAVYSLCSSVLHAYLWMDFFVRLCIV